MDKQSAMLTEETDELHFKKWDKLKTKTKKSKYSTSKKALRIANYHYAKYRYKEPQKNYGLITLQGGTVYLLYFELDTISDEYDTYTFDLKITRTK